MKKGTKRIYQGFAVLIALAVIATGVRPLIFKGEIFYNNWWGGTVFAPLTVIVGLCVLYLVIFK